MMAKSFFFSTDSCISRVVCRGKGVYCIVVSCFFVVCVFRVFYFLMFGRVHFDFLLLGRGPRPCPNSKKIKHSPAQTAQTHTHTHTDTQTHRPPEQQNKHAPLPFPHRPTPRFAAPTENGRRSTQRLVFFFLCGRVACFIFCCLGVCVGPHVHTGFCDLLFSLCSASLQQRSKY